MQLAPVISAEIETVRFDMQLMENPDIQGVEYQRGTLQGWDVREYLLHRHKYTCAYCQGASGDNFLEIDHVIPRSKNGSNKIGNLLISCRKCNVDKGKLLLKEWLAKCSKKRSKLDKSRAANIQLIINGKNWSISYRDAAAVNATRYAIGQAIKQHLPVTFWSGSRTKKNRVEQNYPKDHWVDAACVGESGEFVILEPKSCFLVFAKGHGSRQMCRMDKHGFPRTSAKGGRRVNGFKTGDMVKAVVTKGKKAGTYEGRVAIRSNGYFNIMTISNIVQGISCKNCQIIQKCDGYGYSFNNTVDSFSRTQFPRGKVCG